MSPEDGIADTVRPRLEAAGADLRRVHYIDGVGYNDADQRMFRLPDHIRDLHDKIQEYRAGLVILDPLSSALSSKIDSYKDQDVRCALVPLAKVAEETGATVLAVRHLAKAVGGRAGMAGLGSVAFGAVARVVLGVYQDPDAPDRRVLAVAKCNIARPAPSLAFDLLTCAGGCARVRWLGESQHTADSLTAARGVQSVTRKQTGAAAWLRDFLAHGPADSREIMRQGCGAGFSARGLHRAKEQLGVESDQHGFGGEKRSFWRLPAPAEKDGRGAITSARGDDGGIRDGRDSEGVLAQQAAQSRHAASPRDAHGVPAVALDHARPEEQ